MPYSRTLRPSSACLAAFALFLLLPSAASARTTTAQLRVVSTAGATLADQSQVTGDVTIRSDSRAMCFGPPGGSGANVNVPGPSALGIVKDASDSNGALRPFLVTDQFGFGLGVCGFGAARAAGNASWYLKVNHVGAQVGGDQYRIKKGDEVLWYLAPSFPYPNELALEAPGRAAAGEPFSVRVTSYDDSGNRTPVSGATVTGADLPTAADGTATVQIAHPKRIRSLHASRAADIPGSARLCVGRTLGKCPKRAGERIVGTRRGDRIKGTRGSDRVIARAGRDRINVRGGDRDRVNCGRGRDRVVLGRGDIEKRCERVVRRS